ncbi:uncharacterized protein AC631_02196 [Debaryomyces fabryi]|uniref:Potassium channel domain-containing protein n=1 Tax=Debaryomyces fabryi TaxID=58627 RepID=A0A0V1Q0T6_9ASCO|nr:uncharacterized protein AC631_02196 [Debaryomyces fabryi]KSA02054.1 hypothetical protein AC631_02196 [Debaryomyces fabryi]
MDRSINKKENGIFNNLGRRTKYQRKILPLIFDGYESQNKNIEVVENEALYLKQSLIVPINRITNLSLNPGDPYFLIWYFISSYFPLICACLGPLANMVSVIALIVHWRIEIENNQFVSDQKYLLVLNSLSLALGIIGNLSLLMNFSKTVKYLIAQFISITCWLVAGTLLLVVVIQTDKSFKGHSPHFRPSEGFWFGVFTTFFYYCCSIILIINFIGYKLKKYPPSFNLDYKQRTLMLYTICFSIWLTIGAVVIGHLIPHLNYGSSLYFCIVSALTIGLGDILPHSPGAKIFVLVFSFIGVIIMVLIITMIRQVILSSDGPTVFWHLVEKQRVKEILYLNNNSIHLDEKESFYKMQSIRKKAKLIQRNVSLLLSIVIFFIMWFGGATVFFFCEGWSYIDAFYFCFLCLITIGYGDFAPKSSLGRVFFVSWGIAAVPLMTIIVSNVGDRLYEFADNTSYFISKWFNKEYYGYLNAKKDPTNIKVNSKVGSDGREESIVVVGESQELNIPNRATSQDIVRTNSIDKIGSFEESILDNSQDQKNNEQLVMLMAERKRFIINIVLTLDRLKPLILDALESPLKSYEHREWSDVLFETDKNKSGTMIVEPKMDMLVLVSPENILHSWIGDSSPLRLPLNEPRYLIMNIIENLENHLHDINVRYLDRYEILLK